MTTTKDQPHSDMLRIRDAMLRAEKTVTLRPERGQRMYRNVARVEDGTLCDVDEAGRRLVVDMGKALGGDDMGPNPSMVLRSAISSCLAIGIKQWAARRGVAVDHISVALETELDARGQLGVRDDISPGFAQFAIFIEVKSRADRKLIDDVIATALRYSPLMDVLEKPQRIVRNVMVVNGTAVGE